MNGKLACAVFANDSGDGSKDSFAVTEIASNTYGVSTLTTALFAPSQVTDSTVPLNDPDVTVNVSAASEGRFSTPISMGVVECVYARLVPTYETDGSRLLKLQYFASHARASGGLPMSIPWLMPSGPQIVDQSQNSSEYESSSATRFDQSPFGMRKPLDLLDALAGARKDTRVRLPMLESRLRIGTWVDPKNSATVAYVSGMLP